MTRSVTFCADDFGLSRGITDTILETVDEGPVTQASIIPNGEAVEYALAEYGKRKDRLALAVHINLTEGKPLSPPHAVPRLVGAHGFFRYGAAGLWLAYLAALPRTRRALRAEVKTELAAQLARITTLAGVDRIGVNGHQHAHLIPFIFDELVALGGISAVRILREPFIGGASLGRYAARFVLHILSRRARRGAARRGIAVNDFFVGFVHSGQMTEERLRAGLARAGGSGEVLFHPGSALSGELASWRESRADIAWHYSSWRDRERATLLRISRDATARFLRLDKGR